MANKPSKDPPKGIYQHYKGGLYEVIGIADDPESAKRYVVYKALGLLQNLLPRDPENNFYPTPLTPTPNKGELAVSSVERFTEEVDGKEYHQGKRIPRFRLVS